MLEQVADNKYYQGIRILQKSTITGVSSMYGTVGRERFDLGFGWEEVLTGPHAVETNKP